MLEARRLTRHYGASAALESLDLKIGTGEIYCMLGANGAGKTTTIRLFLGFLQPTSGQALIKGLDVTVHPRESKRHIAYIPEQVMLYGHLSGLENLRYFAALGPDDCPDDPVLEKALLEAGLPEGAIPRLVSTYSKGMKQKVGIALALVKNAEVLLLDEPTSGLDPQAAREFSETVRRMAQRGTAVLMVTHDLFHARDLATRIGIMKRGRLVEDMEAARTTYQDLENCYIRHMTERTSE